MKTIILTIKEQKKLSKNSKEEIANILQEREITISELKKKIKDLPEQSFTFRRDINQLQRSEKADNLIIDCFHKTAGEQWGNAAGWKYTLNVGRKYLRLLCEFSGTDLPFRELEIILDPKVVLDHVLKLEEAFKEETQEVDKQTLINQVCISFDNLIDEYQGY